MIASISLSLADYGVLIGILAPLVAWPARQMLKRLERIDGRMTTFDEELERMRNDKVDKREWLRAELSSRAKIDRLLEGQAELSGKLDAHLGVAAAVNRLADRIGRGDGEAR